MQTVIDHGDHDPLPPVLGGAWSTVAKHVRASLPNANKDGMTAARCAKVLRHNNAWRNGKVEDMGSPGELTLALDYAASVLERMP